MNLLKFWIRIQQYTADAFKFGQKLLLRLKRLISPFLEVGFQNFFHNNMQYYKGKVKLIKWN